MDPIKKGDLALCSLGELGLITSDHMVPVNYADGTTGNAWTGIYISREHLGDEWCSRNPTVVGNLHKVMFYNEEFSKNFRRVKLNGK